MIHTLEPTGQHKTIIIVGAGLAGLAAAYELSHAGHDVTVLEAKTRPGGRVCTLRESFSNGLYAEAGGEYIYPTHPDYAMPYIRHFGLSVMPLELTDKAGTAYLRHRRLHMKQGAEINWPYNLTQEERRLGLAGMRHRYIREPNKEFFATQIGQWPQPLLEQYDAKTFNALLQEAGASSDAINLLRMMDFDFLGEDEQNTSAIELLGDRVKFSQFTKPFYAIQGGNDLLPQGFARHLPQRIHYGAAVTRIQHSPQSVQVNFIQNGETQLRTAEYLVVAIPFSVLRHIEITPGMSREKHRVIQELPYSSVCRVYFQSRENFWKKEGLTGLGITDLPITYFWESSWRQTGSRGILQAYASGATARTMAAMEETEQMAFAIEQAEKVHPTIQDMTEGGTVKCWDTDPWARGGYSYYLPGSMKLVIPYAAQPEGRIHFAGEHTTSCYLHATIQGALESGIRVAQEIHQSC